MIRRPKIRDFSYPLFSKTIILSGIVSALMLGGLSACLSGEDAFVDGKLQDLCDHAYQLCSLPAGCMLDSDHYVEGGFPGVQRVGFVTEEPDTPVRIRLFLTEMVSPGTEFLIQVYEADCTMDSRTQRVLYEDVDIFEEAGNDRLLFFDFEIGQEGEHLVELYCDGSMGYLLVVETEF